MSGIFDKFRKDVISSVWKKEEEAMKLDHEVDDLIALGVLLWEVAQADDQFLPEEKDKLSEVLQKYGNVRDADMNIVLRSIEEASIQKIDLHTFTSEINKDLVREVKIEILENLFRVACCDQDLDEKEHEIIRKVANLLRLDHQEFINAKIKVKKEFGLDTLGI